MKVMMQVTDTELSKTGIEESLRIYREVWEGSPPHTIMVHPMRKILAKELVKNYDIRVFTIRLPINTWMVIGPNGIVYSDEEI